MGRGVGRGKRNGKRWAGEGGEHRVLRTATDRSVSGKEGCSLSAGNFAVGRGSCWWLRYGCYGTGVMASAFFGGGALSVVNGVGLTIFRFG